MTPHVSSPLPPPPPPSPPPDAPECPICLEQYDDTTTVPRVLPCGHSTCDACLRRLHHLSTTSSSSLSPPHTLRCPTCTHLVSVNLPSSLPKNIDLLRFSLLTVKTTLDNPHRTRRRFTFVPEIVSDDVYNCWKNWIIPYDVVLTDDCVVGRVKLEKSGNEIIRCRLVDDHEVCFLEVGRFGLSDSFLEYSYVSKVMSVLNCTSDAKRGELISVLRASVRVSRVCRVLGLWLDVESGCLYLVSERMNDELLDLSVRNRDCGDDLGSIGVELCEVLIGLQREGIVCGCLGLSCVCFDEFGRVHVDLNEVLVKGRKVRECVVTEVSRRRKSEHNGSKGAEFIASLLEMDVFVSPEVMLDLVCRAGIKSENNDLSYAVCNRSDVWLLACVMLKLFIGNEFVECICKYLKAICEGTNEFSDMYSEFVDKLKASLETIMGSGSESQSLLQTLVKCLDYDPEHRPGFADVWKNFKAYNLKTVARFNLAMIKDDIGQCLVLSELCIESSRVRNDSSTSNLNEERDDAVEPSQVGEISVDDVVEGLTDGKLHCKDLVGHLDCITGFCFGGGFLFCSSFDKTVSVWSLQDFTHVHTFRGHEHRVMAMCFVDQEKPLCISADSGGGIFLWEVTQPFGEEPLKKWYEEKDWRYSGIHALVASESGYLYTGSGDRLIKAWLLKDHTLHCSMEGHKSVVSTLALSNGVLYSGSWDGTVRLWSLHDHTPLAVFSDDKPGTVSSVLCLRAQQNMVIAAYENGHVKIWMNDVLKSSKRIHNGAAHAVAMEENWLFSGGWDKTVKVQEIHRAGGEIDIRDVGSIACDSVITALMYVQGILLVGYANRLIKAFHRRNSNVMKP
ncbi:hypothetical protein RND81_01G153000 [Saponaria officinalis]|uniref:Uncharacterized protein n=1 Tax=Saponaria officinalis TaxID=3572 RepID=A0AAW1NA32_SAPOF